MAAEPCYWCPEPSVTHVKVKDPVVRRRHGRIDVLAPALWVPACRTHKHVDRRPSKATERARAAVRKRMAADKQTTIDEYL